MNRWVSILTMSLQVFFSCLREKKDQQRLERRLRQHLDDSRALEASADERQGKLRSRSERDTIAARKSSDSVDNDDRKWERRLRRHLIPATSIDISRSLEDGAEERHAQGESLSYQFEAECPSAIQSYYTAMSRDQNNAALGRALNFGGKSADFFADMERCQATSLQYQPQFDRIDIGGTPSSYYCDELHTAEPSCWCPACRATTHLILELPKRIIETIKDDDLERRRVRKQLFNNFLDRMRCDVRDDYDMVGTQTFQ